MNKDDLIRMAREAGLPSNELYHPNLERFAALVAAAERQACAQLADEAADNAGDPYCCALECRGIAEAIRAREQA